MSTQPYRRRGTSSPEEAPEPARQKRASRARPRKPDASADAEWQDMAGAGGDDTAEGENETQYWYHTYLSQEKAREKLRQERLAAGGDESLFRFIAADSIGEPEPVSLDKGGILLSRGIHRISGPPGGGKTRIGYWDVLARVHSGERWGVFDQEMGPERYKQAMIQLGASEDDLSRIDYIDTQDSVTPDLIRHGRALTRVLTRRGCSGILYDSQTPFLAASGISENDPQGVRAWTIAACSGMSCSIVLDHTGFSDDSRGRGTSDKGAGCDVDLYLKVITPFAIERSGKILLGVTKDRSGTLAAGSEMIVDVSCWDGGMDFQPRDWDLTGDSGSGAVTVAEALAMLLLQDKFKDRSYALAHELQKVIRGTKADKIRRIELAVKSGSVLEREVGKAKQYSLP
jgi:hypothetical protein